MKIWWMLFKNFTTTSVVLARNQHQKNLYAPRSTSTEIYWYLYRRQALYKILWLCAEMRVPVICFRLGVHTNCYRIGYHRLLRGLVVTDSDVWLIYFQTPIYTGNFCKIRHWQGSLHCTTLFTFNHFFTQIYVIESYLPYTKSRRAKLNLNGKDKSRD